VAGSTADRGPETWCAAHIWLGSAAANLSDFTGALSHFTAVRDAAAGQPQPLADALAGRAIALVNLGRIPEGISDARQAVTVARDAGYPAGEALSLANLAMAMFYARDLDSAISWARQACQVDPAAISGRIARWCREVMTLIQMQARQAASARSGSQDGLAWSRQAGDLAGQLFCSATIAWLDVRAGHLPQASAYLRQALEIGVRTGGLADLAGCLDCCGHLCAASQRWAEAITIWAAHATRVQADMLPHPSLAAEDRHEPLQAARQALGPDQARAAEQRGAAMTLATAVEFAVMITQTTSQPASPLPGPGNLSPRERELLTLLAQGCTDAQIADQLCISIRTVRSHLDRIRDKTNCRRRADLTRLALATGLI
jgi:DNA-binding CsgD family transcriptional regulator